MNALVIAGYNVLADRPEFDYHQEFIKKSFERAIVERITAIFVVGGATNPDYPDLTEAGTAEKVLENIKREFNQKKIYTKEQMDIPILVLPVGNTSAETLRAVKDYFERSVFVVNKLIYCVELARCVGFGMDGLFEGLNEFCNELMIFGYRLPESKEEFKAQKRKLFIKLLSHQGKVFDLFRRIYQKLHQIRVARIVRK